MADKVVAVERTRQAIDAINAGDIQGGRALLAEALSIDPEYELAWLWFAAVAETDPEKKFCLEAARKVNPLHEANAALGPLRGIKPDAPKRDDYSSSSCAYLGELSWTRKSSCRSKPC